MMWSSSGSGLVTHHITTVKQEVLTLGLKAISENITNEFKRGERRARMFGIKLSSISSS